MPSLLQAFYVLALLNLVFAAPHPAQKRSFKVERVANPNYVGRTAGAGTRALIKAYNKHSMTLPASLVEAMNNGANPAFPNGNSKAATGSTTAVAAAASGSGAAGTGVVAATPETGDTEYLSEVDIGGQKMNMDFDSGSSDLWVFSTQLPTASQAGHQNFDASKSTSFKAIQGSTWSISYGDGSGAAGNVGTDTVNIGGATVTGQAIEMATAVSASFVSDTQSNGLVGLAFSKLNTVKPAQQKTFFDNAMAQGLAQPVFTADLRKAAAGSYEFGNIDATKFNGSLTWAAVNTTQGFWQFSSSKFTVGGGAATAVPNGQAIADTGTTLMLADPNIINGYYSKVQGAVNNQTVGGVTFPCSAKLPDLAVDVGGTYMAIVRGDDINYAPVDSTGTTCFGGLQATTSNLQIYGDIMFKSQFVAFNGGNNSLGMAPHQG
ncbi:aspartyl protease [Sclerotinia borealis F-4128]|uniref:Aspartyl protease n=1 Tax=Sclerotinia borealis (strain F-4128) TaxID=1432307 RepID=W9C3E6_SCLBF|nr:aspartyl protease [Sclerotinia borealis F-4128]